MGNKPREWTIFLVDGSFDILYDSDETLFGTEDNEERVPVIEKSAYDELEKQFKHEKLCAASFEDLYKKEQEQKLKYLQELDWYKKAIRKREEKLHMAEIKIVELRQALEQIADIDKNRIAIQALKQP